MPPAPPPLRPWAKRTRRTSSAAVGTATWAGTVGELLGASPGGGAEQLTLTQQHAKLGHGGREAEVGLSTGNGRRGAAQGLRKQLTI